MLTNIDSCDNIIHINNRQMKGRIKMEETTTKKGFSTRELVFTAMFAVLMAICSWISIPTTVPFTLQTFGVFCALWILGGKKGFFAVLTYILLGAVGVPVFAGFSGGIGVLLGTTGGYIVGFLFTALIFMGAEKLFGDNTVLKIIALVVGLLVCYAFGTVWFMNVYAKNSGEIGLMTALGWCVFPFIVPDLIKLALAVVISGRVKKYVKM